VKLRGRFTLTFALAALVPIAVAAVMTGRVIATSYREDYEATRRFADKTVQLELGRLQSQVADATNSLASRENPFVGSLLLSELPPADGTFDKIAEENRRTAQRRLREQSGLFMRGLSLDILAITGPDDRVKIAPHFRGELDSGKPEIRQLAEATKGAAFFARDKVMTASTIETVLVAEAAKTATDRGYTVAVLAGRRVTDDMLASVRRPGRVDARIVTPSGEVLLPPAEKDWASLAKDPPLRTPLVGPDGTPVAYIEAAVSDGDLDHVLFVVELTSAALALGALGAVVLVGLFVARRTARDLDMLVAGAVAAARGELDHRVPVRSADEVGEVANAFNLMMEDLKTSKERLVIAERIAAWQEIARRLAHEIKNPLTPIQMAMDTLRKSWRKQHPSFGEIMEESTTTVLQEADRLKHIVAEFSDFARLPKPELARMDLNEVVRSSLALYQGGAIPVDVTLDSTLPQLDGDKNQINQVLLNLVENARDALGDREGGRIAVSTKYVGDRALLVVEDNGPGVPAEVKDKVFAPYFTTKHDKGGTGLGLAIVHRIVSDHGGRITITDAPGGGARFAIELPLRDGESLLASRSEMR